MREAQGYQDLDPDCRILRSYDSKSSNRSDSLPESILGSWDLTIRNHPSDPGQLYYDPTKEHMFYNYKTLTLNKKNP